MTRQTCTYLKDAFDAPEPDRAAFEAHVAGCADCARALSSIATLTSNATSWTKKPGPPLETSRVSSFLSERRRLDILITAFAVSEVAMLQFGGGALGFARGQQAFLVVVLVAAVVFGLRWLQRRAMVRSFAAETLVGHFKVTTRAAERRGKWLVAGCVAWVLFCFLTIPFSHDNPVAIVSWLRSGPSRLAFLAAWPALFAGYTCIVTLPRLSRMRADLERT